MKKTLLIFVVLLSTELCLADGFDCFNKAHSMEVVIKNGSSRQAVLFGVRNPQMNSLDFLFSFDQNGIAQNGADYSVGVYLGHMSPNAANFTFIGVPGNDVFGMGLDVTNFNFNMPDKNGKIFAASFSVLRNSDRRSFAEDMQCTYRLN